MTTPDDFVHVFRTYLGIPPSINDEPICGARLTDAYDFPGTERPPCPACQKMAAHEKAVREGHPCVGGVS